MEKKHNLNVDFWVKKEQVLFLELSKSRHQSIGRLFVSESDQDDVSMLFSRKELGDVNI